MVGASVKMDLESSGNGKEVLGAQERLLGHDADSGEYRRIKPRRKRTESRETKAGRTSRVRVPENLGQFLSTRA